MIDIRLPNITGKTEAEQLNQIKSYLYQFAEQLQWALSNVEAGNSSNVPAQSAGQSTNQQEDPVSNFNSIKGLIIKSADIVKAYYDKIDELLKLSGEYTASSDFGIFKEETLNKLSATDKKIAQDLVDKQSIYDENGKIKTELLVNGHIYSGIIEYAKNGEAIIGIEIGQTVTQNGIETFNKFARFTAEMLAFYDPKASADDDPIAYISGYNLYITNVTIKGSFKEGGYKDIIDAEGGVVTKWVGGV